MTQSSAVVDEVVTRVSNQAVTQDERARLEPITNPESGEPEGMVIHSALERVAVFVRAQKVLSLADVSALRRALTRVQARRGYLYVLSDTAIQKPVMLLATLSKIRVVRVEAPVFA
jgi:hypothetical protein